MYWCNRSVHCSMTSYGNIYGKISKHFHKLSLQGPYGCFQKLWYPQIIHFNRVFHYKPSILGYPYFWKHPYHFTLHAGISKPGKPKLSKFWQIHTGTQVNSNDGTCHLRLKAQNVCLLVELVGKGDFGVYNLLSHMLSYMIHDE